jgi:hypothetical protein
VAGWLPSGGWATLAGRWWPSGGRAMVAGLRQSGGSGRALGGAAPGGWPRSRWWPGEEATMWASGQEAAVAVCATRRRRP